MSIFGSIMEKIFHHPSAGGFDEQPVPAATAAASPAPAQVPPATTTSEAVAAAAPAAVPVDAAPVDIEAVLSAMAAQKGGGGNYQTSIVDLLKLLDLDSSLDARKHLAQELDVHVGADGSAEQNIALYKAVTHKLEQSGGKVPDSMKG